MILKQGRAWVFWERKWADLWVGAFWQRRKPNVYATIYGYCVEELHIWVCLIPCFPIHFIIGTRYKVIGEP